MTKWKLIVYESELGRKPVEHFLRTQSPPTLAKILRMIDLLGKYGAHLSMPHSKHLQKGIFELRVRGKEEIRVLYAFFGKDIYLVHAFKKKTQKTPQKEMNIALKRVDLVSQKR